jgi:hypothetical protein
VVLLAALVWLGRMMRFVKLPIVAIFAVGFSRNAVFAQQISSFPFNVDEKQLKALLVRFEADADSFLSKLNEALNLTFCAGRRGPNTLIVCRIV